MNNQESKFILGAYRPGGHDANDPDFQEALEQANRDPALREWFEGEQAFDAAMAEGLRRVRPPADLKANILVGARVSRPAPWRWPVRLAVAAIVLLCAAVAVVSFRAERTPAIAGWQRAALDFVSHDVVFDRESPEAKELVDYLKAANSPTVNTLPATLEKLRALGCKQLERDGARISVICFQAKDGRAVHLVITDRADGPAVEPGHPVYGEHDGWAMATWPEGSHTVMLATRGSVADLKRYL